MKYLLVFLVELWWFLDKLSGKIWGKFCPQDKVFYYLDFLPAFFYVKRNRAERRVWEYRTGEKL